MRPRRPAALVAARAVIAAVVTAAPVSAAETATYTLDNARR